MLLRLLLHEVPERKCKASIGFLPGAKSPLVATVLGSLVTQASAGKPRLGLVRYVGDRVVTSALAYPEGVGYALLALVVVSVLAGVLLGVNLVMLYNRAFKPVAPLREVHSPVKTRSIKIQSQTSYTASGQTRQKPLANYEHGAWED